MRGQAGNSLVMSPPSRDGATLPTPAVIASRPTRVLLLIVACVLMGLTDLACTAAYLGGIGMIEQNPLARFVIREGGLLWLVVFKLLTMIVMGACIYACRRHAMGERCAWACCALLMMLMFHWTQYNDVADALSSDLVLIASTPEPHQPDDWVRFDR